MIDLDANFLVDALKGGVRSHPRFQAWLDGAERISMSSIAWSEFLCGPLHPEDVLAARSLVSAIEPFTEGDAQLASELFNRTGRRSRSHPNCMIAALAIRRKASLATLNHADFRRFEAFDLQLA